MKTTKKKIGSWLAVFFLVSCFAFGIKLGNLKEVLKPETIDVFGDKLYVLQDCTTFIYSLKDLSLKGKFGKKGQGPGEMIPETPICITASNEYIFVESHFKFLFYSKEGKLLKEQNLKTRISKLLPIKENFAAIVFAIQEDFTPLDYSALKVYDSQMKEIKELYRQKNDPQSPVKFSFIPDTINFCVYDDKIFVEESPKGIFIEVFDKEGNKLYHIKQDDEKVPVTEEMKKYLIDHLKEHEIVISRGWDNFKKHTELIFPANAPAIKNLVVDNKTIYLQTFKQKDNREEYIIMDLKGNNPKKVYLPRVKEATIESQLIGKGLKLYAIRDNKFIYLAEDEEEEIWEVYMEEIKY